MHPEPQVGDIWMTDIGKRLRIIYIDMGTIQWEMCGFEGHTYRAECSYPGHKDVAGSWRGRDYSLVYEAPAVPVPFPVAKHIPDRLDYIDEE